MKTKIWFVQIPVILFFTSAYLFHEVVLQGYWEPYFLHKKNFVTQAINRISDTFIDFKFRLRGPIPVKNKIVIVEIDEASMEAREFGRWPWHRDVFARLVQRLIQLDAKVVGIDLFFSLPDERIPDEVKTVLSKTNWRQMLRKYQSDSVFEKVINENVDRIVLGWAVNTDCLEKFFKKDCLEIKDPRFEISLPKTKFAYKAIKYSGKFSISDTPVFSSYTVLDNLDSFSNAARNAGYLNTVLSEDNVIRRERLAYVAGGHVYAPLGVSMARLGLGDEVEVAFDHFSRIDDIKFLSSGKHLPVNPRGESQINFRGPGRSFKYVSAYDILNDDPNFSDNSQQVAGVAKTEILKDAYVIVGLSAIGVYDMRSFPFDPNVPGVEGHATVLDNILSGDFLKPSAGHEGFWAVLALMTVGDLLIAFVAQRLSAIPAFALFALLFSVFGYVDIHVLFQSNQNWETSFLFFELLSIFVLVVAAKYVTEEKHKKFIREAFSKYVSPAVVDSIIKDPTQLSLGGEKKNCTILFSDIRGFTTFSEQMDAKSLAGFLNEYFGIMTEIIFSFQGTLDKYIGDAIMAFWGAPVNLQGHARNACLAAVEMQNAARQIRSRVEKKWGIQLETGIGLTSGLVNVGNMGTEKNFEYTVIGDKVNLASRLESLTKEYQVQILTTLETIDEVRNQYGPPVHYRVLDDVKVKGKKSSVTICELLDRPMPVAIQSLFERARAYYVKQEWDKAIESFIKVRTEFSREFGRVDGPSDLFLKRCFVFKNQPPATSWDGTWEMDKK